MTLRMKETYIIMSTTFESCQIGKEQGIMPAKSCNLCNFKIFNKVFYPEIEPRILAISCMRFWRKCKNLRLHRLHRLHRTGSVLVYILRFFKRRQKRLHIQDLQFQRDSKSCL